MWRVICSMFVLLPAAEMVLAADGLYRCADGTFTNRVERQCPPYEAKGIVRVQGETTEATKLPFAEVKLFTQSGKRETGR